ncbi:acyl-CoA dehydrogenase family protein, partial [SAR202 cluster bacterium AD-802-K11_MRT_200m]|nr:acyl-CoA dehydrogenase family protein [SAR202 cluster bacterium AD-802-K11_MRT_200m]
MGGFDIPLLTSLKYLSRGLSLSSPTAPTSHHFDLNASFPTEHFDLMREKGYLKACIPENYGGMGHGI